MHAAFKDELDDVWSRLPREDSGRSTGFTLVEMLAVIGIIMLVMALALPNFISMMKGRKWVSAINNVQTMVMRARALATNVRKDMSVEFDIRGDNGTTMWLESEMNMLERIPDLYWVQDHIGGGYTFSTWVLMKIWWPSGGTWDGDPDRHSFSLNFQIDYANSRPAYYGDNARQSEEVEVGRGMTIDDNSTLSPYFLNWDAPASVENYGEDDHKDIRIGPNGALIQTRDPTLCIKQISTGEYKQVQVVRCTGRLVKVQ